VALGFCPRCGTGRTGAFRYCHSCAFDFEDPAAIGRPLEPQAPAGPAVPSWPARAADPSLGPLGRRRRAREILFILEPEPAGEVVDEYDTSGLTQALSHLALAGVVAGVFIGLVVRVVDGTIDWETIQAWSDQNCGLGTGKPWCLRPEPDIGPAVGAAIAAYFLGLIAIFGVVDGLAMLGRRLRRPSLMRIAAHAASVAALVVPISAFLVFVLVPNGDAAVGPLVLLCGAVLVVTTIPVIYQIVRGEVRARGVVRAGATLGWLVLALVALLALAVVTLGAFRV
jgi:hypothetical protein